MDFPKLFERISRYPQMKRGHLRLIILVGVFGDFDSLEYAQLIRRNLNRLESSGVKILIIGLGDENSQIQFSKYTELPIQIVHFEKNSELHHHLGCAKGLEYKIPPLANLLLMCAGVQSPGTLKEVLRGYTGDKKSEQIYNSSDLIKISPFSMFKGSLFENAGGTGFLRPFEMATIRLENMLEVLKNWNIYMKGQDSLTQRGGTFLLDRDDKLLYKYLPSSLLGYSEDMSNPIGFLDQYL